MEEVYLKSSKIQSLEKFIELNGKALGAKIQSELRAEKGSRNVYAKGETPRKRCEKNETRIIFPCSI